MRGWKTLALAVALVPAGAGMVRAQQPAPAEATISLEKARSIALGQVSNNEGVKSSQLKTKDGVLVYEFDIETPGPGHQEVRVDARTGAVISNKHEDDVVGEAANKVENAAHDAGHAVTHAANETGKAVGHAANETGKAVGHAANDASNKASRAMSGDEVKNAHPRISEARARAIAMRRVPRAEKVKDADLERENGVLVWKVSVDTPGEGHDLVYINANTGRVLRTHHEVGIAGKAKQEVEKITH